MDAAYKDYNFLSCFFFQKSDGILARIKGLADTFANLLSVCNEEALFIGTNDIL